MLAHGRHAQVHKLPEQIVVFPLRIPKKKRADGIFVVNTIEQFPQFCFGPDVFTLELRNPIPTAGDIGYEVGQRAWFDLDLAVLMVAHS